MDLCFRFCGKILKLKICQIYKIDKKKKKSYGAFWEKIPKIKTHKQCQIQKRLEKPIVNVVKVKRKKVYDFMMK